MLKEDGEWPLRTLRPPLLKGSKLAQTFCWCARPACRAKNRTRMASKRTQGSETDNFVDVASWQGMRDLARPNSPPFPKASGFFEFLEGRCGTLHTVSPQRGIRAEHNMRERAAQFALRKPNQPSQNTELRHVSPRQPAPSIKRMSLEPIQPMKR